MQRNILLTYIICLSTIWATQAQSRGRFANQRFLDKQYWVGLRLGTNISKAKPENRYTIYSPTDGKNKSEYEKKYINLKNPAFEGGVDFIFDYKGLGVSLSPTYTRFRYGYENNYAWQDTLDPSFKIDQKTTTSQSLDYFRVPLGIRFAPRQLKLRPSLTLGFYWSTLFAGNRSTQIQKTDFASGGSKTNTAENTLVGNKNLFIKTNLGWFTSMGVSYPFGNLRVSLEVAYWRNTHIITNRKARFNDQYINHQEDIQDDVQLRNLSASITFAMPLRFLSLNNSISE